MISWRFHASSAARAKRNGCSVAASPNNMRNGVATIRPSPRRVKSIASYQDDRVSSAHGGQARRVASGTVARTGEVGMDRRPYSRAAVVEVKKHRSSTWSCNAMLRIGNVSGVDANRSTLGVTSTNEPCRVARQSREPLHPNCSRNCFRAMTPCWRPIISRIALSITFGQWAVTRASGNPSPKFGADVPLSAILAPNFGLGYEWTLIFGVVVALSAMLAPNFGFGGRSLRGGGRLRGGGGRRRCVRLRHGRHRRSRGRRWRRGSPATN